LTGISTTIELLGDLVYFVEELQQHGTHGRSRCESHAVSMGGFSVVDMGRTPD